MADYVRVDITVVRGDRTSKAATRRPLFVSAAPSRIDADIAKAVKEAADIAAAAIKKGDVT